MLGFRASMAVISRVPTEAKRMTLTFDDGPHPVFTEQLLDVLRDEGVQATFFIRGGALDPGTAGLVRREAAEGHDVGNHTHGHLDLDRQPDEVVREEVERAHRDLTEILGRPPDLIRPPYGRAPERVDAIAAPLGYRATVTWSVSTDDWELPGAEAIAERLVAGAQPGAIALLHDGCSPTRPAESREGTVGGVAIAIPRLRALGYELVPVSRLLDERA